MMRGSRLFVLAVGAATCLAASPASAQLVIGESRPNVEVNWSVLDKLGPEPTLPGVLTRKPAPVKAAAPIPAKKPQVAQPPRKPAPQVAAEAAPKAPKTAKPAKVAVDPIPAPAPVVAAPVVAAPAVASAPAVAAKPAPVVEPAKVDAVPGVPPAEKPVASSQPPKPPKLDIAAEVPPVAKPTAEAKLKTPAVPVKAEPQPGAVQFVKAPELPPVPVAAPPVAPAPVVAVPPPPPAPVAVPTPVPVAVPVAPPPMPVVQPVAPPPQQLAAVAPPVASAVRKGDNAAVVFGGESAHLPDSARSDLDRIAQKMERDETLNLQLLAYASGDEANASKARRLSLSRALEVRKYLMEMGVRSTRIEVRALGNKIEGAPADRVDVVLAAR